MQTSRLVIYQVLSSFLDRQTTLLKIVTTACIINVLVLIWAHRFLPLSDYPDWVFEGSVVAALLQGKALASYTFNHYPVPNAAAVALIGVLDLALSPEVSGKVVLSLCALLLALSSVYFLKSLRLEATNPLLLVPLLFLPNTFFFWGELSYILGLSLFLFYGGYLFRRIYRKESVNWWLVNGVSVGLFFCHFLSYATAILVTLMLFISESRIDMLRPFVVSFSPSVGLAVWYAVERLSQKQPGNGWQFWTPHQLAGRLLAVFSPFPEFLPWLGIDTSGMKVFALLNLFVTIAMTLILPFCAFEWARARKRYTGVLACAIVCASAAVAAGYAFGGIISPGERFLYPAVWIGLCWLIGIGSPRENSALSRGLAIVVVALLACQIIFLQFSVAKASNEIDALYAKLRSAKSQTEFCEVYELYMRQSFEKPHRTGLDRFLTSHSSIPRLPYYLYLEKKLEPPIFPTGILNYSDQGSTQYFCEPP